MVRTIPTDYNKCVNAELLELFDTLKLNRFFSELRETSGVQDGTATVDDVISRTRVHLENVTGEQTGVAIVDTVCFEAFVFGLTRYGTHRGVHAWSIPTAGHNTNAFHCFTSRDLSWTNRLIPHNH